MKAFHFSNLLFCMMTIAAVHAEDLPSRGHLIVVQGSDGEESYGQQFSIWSERWIEHAKHGGLSTVLIAPDAVHTPQKQLIFDAIAAQVDETTLPLWIVLIGHGTFDTRQAKFNIEGDDLAARELDEKLADVLRPTVVINCSSASAPFLEELSQANRIVVTSTRSGDQVSFSRFGDFLSQSIGDKASDLDKDEQTSLLEAFLSASRQTLEFYEAEGRIPTENALLDDNGDGRGTRASAFEGTRAIAQPEEEGVLLDGIKAHQFHLLANDIDSELPPEIIARRNQLEQEIELLRLRRSEFDEETYYAELEKKFLEIANLLFRTTGEQLPQRNVPEQKPAGESPSEP